LMVFWSLLFGVSWKVSWSHIDHARGNWMNM
jgi:hypothetical protein